MTKIEPNDYSLHYIIGRNGTHINKPSEMTKLQYQQLFHATDAMSSFLAIGRSHIVY